MLLRKRNAKVPVPGSGMTILNLWIDYKEHLILEYGKQVFRVHVASQEYPGARSALDDKYLCLTA